MMHEKRRAHSPLAIDGGTPEFPDGPPHWPPEDPAVRAALEGVYLDGSWGRYEGRHAAALVATMREHLEIDHVYACCSGTVAVELALRGLRVGPGDEVLLAGYDFPGNFRAVTSTGALPVLVDVVNHGVTIDVAQLDAATGEQTRAVVVSHLHGSLAPVSEVVAWAASRGIAVVEDACQVPGATIDGRAAGTLGDVGTFSFGGSKLLTAGRGGAVVTHRPEVMQRIKVHCEQGNHAYPLSELQAAVLLPQWQQLPARHAQRREAVGRLLARLDQIPGLTVVSDFSPTVDAAYYKLALWYDASQFGGRSREDFVAAVEAEGVALGAGFRGFVQRGSSRCRKVGDLPNSRAAAEQVVLLHHPVLLQPPDVMDRVAFALEKVAHAWSG